MTWTPLIKTTPRKNGLPVNIAVNIGPEEFFENNQYQVHVRTITSDREDVPPMKHLSICRQDKRAVHDWRHFQRIKNELCGPDWEGVEIYPAESRLVDAANQYHLWCFPFSIGFGFSTRMVSSPAQTAVITPGATQREFDAVDLQHGGLTKMKDLQRLIALSKSDGYGDPINPEESA